MLERFKEFFEFGGVIPLRFRVTRVGEFRRVDPAGFGRASARSIMPPAILALGA